MSRSGENNGSIDPVTGRAASTSFSLLSFERMREQRSALSDLFAFAPFSRVNILVDGQPEITGTAQMVSGGYHGGLGVSAALGRTISPEDDRTSAPPVAVISYRYWERRFERRPDVLGKIIAINRVPTTIVGVTAKGFDGAMQAGESPDVSVPLAHYLLFQPDRPDERSFLLVDSGRAGCARRDTGAGSRIARAGFPTGGERGWVAGRPAGTPSDRRMPNPPTLVADLECARRERYAVGSPRAHADGSRQCCWRRMRERREPAARTRRAPAKSRSAWPGAGRGRVVRQLLAESLLLAVASAALGMAFAWWGRDSAAGTAAVR